MGENVGVILDRTRHAANIGAVCRVMKNLGFRKLHLVDPTEFGYLSAVRLLRGSEDILENASFHSTIGDAVSSYHYTFATSHRMRKEEAVGLVEGAGRIEKISGERRVAVLFGSEKYGLSAKETEKANGVISLPVDARFPSVNLAQAVAMVLTQVRLSAGGFGEAAGSDIQNGGETRLMKGETERFVSEFTSVAERVGFRMPSIELKIRSVFERAEMDRSEYNLLFGLLRILKRRIFGGEEGKKY